MNLTTTLASPTHALADDTEAESLSLRLASPSDLPHIGTLLRLRDGHPWDDADVRRAVCDWNPARCSTWLAMVGNIPVGMSSIQLRTLQCGTDTYRAGYWTLLYVHPEYRLRMVYPTLPQAMFRAAKAEGLDFIYANVRLPRVARSHQRIGFKAVAEMPVLAKPLRPVQLLVRHKGLKLAPECLGRPLDGLYAAYLRLRWWHTLGNTPATEQAWDSPELVQVAALWREAKAGYVAQQWTADLLRKRYAAPGPAANYGLSVVRRKGRVAAAAVYRAVSRERLRTGILLDLVYAEEDTASAQRVLAAAEHAMYDAGCQVMLALDGPDTRLGPVLRGYGYLRSSEKYAFLILPCRALAPGSPLYDASRWNYGFGDHDAF